MKKHYIILLSILFKACLGRANPQGGVISAGEASISSTGNKMDITQFSEKAVIDWRSFDIKPDEITQFHQPSSNAIILNRVNSNNASLINGQLTANGNIVIVNQNGIIFGDHAKVDVNGLIASTINIDNNKFMKNNAPLSFDQPGKENGFIINNGSITTKEAGLVGLIAPNVINNGLIIANSGKIQLASGNSFTIDMYGDKLIEFAISSDLKSQLIANNGLLQADGGKIIINAASGQKIVNSLIEIKGELKAPTAMQKNGEILIYAEGSNAVKNNISVDKGKKQGTSKVVVSAKLDVSGKEKGEKAGNIIITGDNVALLDGTIIDARGCDGLSNTTSGLNKYSYRNGSAGGDVQIGGDYLGKGNTPTAKNLYVQQNVLVINDAINSGDAGRSIFWSDDTTQFYGKVYARALGGKEVNPITGAANLGGNAGDGGFVETSGHKFLDAAGDVNLTSSNGNTGTYFLDPTSIAIYGNVTPQFISTDGSINLASNLKLWLDASNNNSIELNYKDLSITATGNAGGNTLTVSSTSILVPGTKIMLGGDVYVISSIAENTLTLTTPLTTNYSAAAVYGGYVQAWADQSGQGNNAIQTNPASQPLWLNNQQNNNPLLNLSGSNGFSVNLDFLAGVSHTAFLNVNTSVYSGLYGATNPVTGVSLRVGFASNTRYVVAPGTNSLIPISTAFNPNNLNILTYQWVSGSTKSVYANTNLEGSASSGVVGIPAGGGNIGNIVNIVAGQQVYWAGKIAEIIMYNTNLSADNINLINQYQAAKWNQPLVPPGGSSSGTSEAIKAMASVDRGDSADGYSIFSSDYLTKLSESANINLTAGSSIVLDLKGSTLTVANDKNFTLTSGGSISSVSSGIISTTRTTTGGNINLTAAGLIDIPTLQLNTNNGGTVSLVAGTSATFASNISNINRTSITIGNNSSATDIQLTMNKIYDGTNIGTVSVNPPAIFSGVPSVALQNKNVGTYAYDISSLVNNSNIIINNPGQYYYLPPATTANITKATLAVTGLSGVDKVYNANTTATIAGTPTVAPLGSDAVTVSGTAAGAFDNKNVGTAKAINLSGLSLSGTDAGNYLINLPTSLTANITQATLAITGLSGVDKVYNANTIATIAGSPTISPIAGDSVNIAGAAAGAFSDKNVGTVKAINVSGLSLSGADAGNYLINLPLTANITQATLAVTGLTGVDKVYNANTLATIAGNPSISPIAGDSVNITGTAAGTFADKNVGTAKAINVSGLSLNGADASNYLINLPTSLNASITPAPLVVTANNQTINYSQETPIFSYDYTGMLKSDTKVFFTGQLSYIGGNNVGSYEINLGNLQATGNYYINSYIPGTYTILRDTTFLPTEVYNYISGDTLQNSFINSEFFIKKDTIILEFEGLKDFDAIYKKR